MGKHCSKETKTCYSCGKQFSGCDIVSMGKNYACRECLDGSSCEEVTVDMEDDLFMKLAQEANNERVTFSMLVAHILKEQIENAEKNRETEEGK